MRDKARPASVEVTHIHRDDAMMKTLADEGEWARGRGGGGRKKGWRGRRGGERKREREEVKAFGQRRKTTAAASL